MELEVACLCYGALCAQLYAQQHSGRLQCENCNDIDTIMGHFMCVPWKECWYLEQQVNNVNWPDFTACIVN